MKELDEFAEEVQQKLEEKDQTIEQQREAICYQQERIRDLQEENDHLHQQTNASDRQQGGAPTLRPLPPIPQKKAQSAANEDSHSNENSFSHPTVKQGNRPGLYVFMGRSKLRQAAQRSKADKEARLNSAPNS